MCGGGRAPSGPSAAEIAAREQAAADAARKEVEAKAAAEAKAANEAMLAGKKSAADAEAAALEKQQTLLGSMADEENQKNKTGKSTLLGG